jgi:RNA polymerase sigma factor (sigma-70 family)
METQFETMSNYISLAKKTINKFAPKFYNGLNKEMLSSEEAISDVATALMYADWRFDPNREGKEGNKKTLYSYRNQCAIWAIKTYVTQKYKGSNKKYKTHSLDNYFNDADSTNGYNVTENKTEQDPLDILIENETNNNISSDINRALNSGIISEKQKQQLMMYYFDDMTLSQIGKKFNVSREAIRQNIKRAIQLIRNYDDRKDSAVCNIV